MKSKVMGLILVTLISTLYSTAQSIDNAKRMFYYERFKSAKEELQKLVAADNKNAEAYHWLVATQLMQGDNAGARLTATNALTATNGNALVQVSMGHVLLVEGNKPQAKSSFEKAISVSDKKSLINTLVAIGRANGSVNLLQSDADYAIEKLLPVVQKDPNNAEALIVLGDCYRRKIDGSNAVANYMKVATTVPQYARAQYRIGQVYKTQDNCKSLTNYFTEASTVDANYMPAWRELYESYGNDESTCFDIAKARTYLDKFIATSDAGFESDKIKMTFCYYSRDYNCALTEAKAIETKYDEAAKADMQLWKGYIYDKLRDSVSSLASFDSYFAMQKDPNTIDFRVYKKVADVSSKVPGKEKVTMQYYEKFLEKAEDNRTKVPVYGKIAEMYEKSKDYTNAAIWYQKLIDAKETPQSVDYYKVGVNQYNAGNYTASSATFITYDNKFPTDYRGNFWAARSHAQIDSTMAQGLAVPFYEKYLTIAEAEANKPKNGMLEANKYLFAYYFNIKNDKVAAKANLEKIKLIDPTSAAIAEFEAVLTNGKPNVPKAAAPSPKPTPTPKPAVTPKAGTKAQAKPTSAKVATKATTATTKKNT